MLWSIDSSATLILLSSTSVLYDDYSHLSGDSSQKYTLHFATKKLSGLGKGVYIRNF